MAVRLIAGADAEQAFQALTEADHALTRIPAHGTDVSFFVEYCRWALDQARVLRSLIRPQSLDELIFTPRYTLLQTVGAASQGRAEAPHLRLLTSAEIEARHSALTAEASGLRQEIDAWAEAGHLIVPDTNVFLHHRDKFNEVPWGSLVDDEDSMITVVVPITVLKELDRQKFVGRQNQLRWRASYSLSRIESMVGGALDSDSVVMHPSGPIRIRVTTNPLGHEALPTADDEIISHALTIQGYAGRSVLLATFDTNMAFTARRAGLLVSKFSREALHKESAPRDPH